MRAERLAALGDPDSEQGWSLERSRRVARRALDVGKIGLDFWTHWALSLTIQAQHITVAPFPPDAETRRSDQHLEIDLRMEAMLTRSPETGRSASKSIAHAARVVHHEMSEEAAEIREVIGRPYPSPPAARAIEKDYHRRKRAGGSRLTADILQQSNDVRVLADLEQAAAAVERRLKDPRQIW